MVEDATGATGGTAVRMIELRNERGQLCGRLYPDTMELEIKPKGGPLVRVELVRVLGGSADAAAVGDEG
jgi:hypothetical protein